MQMPPVDRPPTRLPTGADLSVAGTSGVAPVRAAENATPAATTGVVRRPDAGLVRSPDSPSVADAPNRDWTAVRKKETVEEPPEPPKEPISKQLLEFLQSMWRASGMAVEIAQELNKPSDWQQQRKAEPLTYADLNKVKKTSDR